MIELPNGDLTSFVNPVHVAAVATAAAYNPTPDTASTTTITTVMTTGGQVVWTTLTLAETMAKLFPKTPSTQHLGAYV